ncbi:unnamed protein product, partial [Urochloa humidicola]
LLLSISPLHLLDLSPPPPLDISPPPAAASPLHLPLSPAAGLAPSLSSQISLHLPFPLRSPLTRGGGARCGAGWSCGGWRRERGAAEAGGTGAEQQRLDPAGAAQCGAIWQRRLAWAALPPLLQVNPPLLQAMFPGESVVDQLVEDQGPLQGVHHDTK